MSSMADYMKQTQRFPGNLMYAWVIKFNDGSVLRQFTGAQEAKFPAEMLAEISSYYLIDVMGTIYGTIDLHTGVITFKGDVPILPHKKLFDHTDPVVFRLISFRRPVYEIKGYQDGRTEKLLLGTTYHFGWQTTIKEGETDTNIKVTIALNEQGQYHWGD